VDVIRLLISEGKSLSEVCEIICDHCLAPDTSSGAGIGCDNMTILIVALLHGRTEEEWVAWVTDRVKQNYGYVTPRELPQLYSQSRLTSFRTRLKAEEDRERNRQGRDGNSSPSSSFDSREMGPFAGFARVLGSTGGITFYPGATNGNLMFVNDGDNESNEDGSDEEDDDPSSRAFGFPLSSDGDGDAHMVEMDDEDEEQPPGAFKTSPPSTRQGETPPPPKPLSNGEAKPEQLTSDPQGDAPSDAVRAEGLLDSSESPLKV